jgi:acyl dehydratase
MPEVTVVSSLDDFQEFVGADLGRSDWVVISQDRIDAFAGATDDHQWIHTDVERARRESPWKQTIAHGYLTLSMAPTLLKQLIRVEGSSQTINTGIEKLRLSSPVLAGSRIRLAASVKHTRQLPGGGVRVVYHLVFEAEASAKPAAVADVVYAYLP